ncbi:MAG: DUF3014 domain-containing protein [Acidobacteriota bacterium]
MSSPPTEPDPFAPFDEIEEIDDVPSSNTDAFSDDLPLHEHGEHDFPLAGNVSTPAIDRPANRGFPIVPIVVVTLLVAMAAGVGWWWASRDVVEPEAEEPPIGSYARPPAPAPAEPEPPPPPALVLPALDESDEVVRRETLALIDHPTAAEWLARPDLVRRFVATIDSVARGDSPRKIVPFLAPEGGFRAISRPGASSDTRVIDPSSYNRYDTLATVVGRANPAAVAFLYRGLSPLLDQAYGEIAPPGASFDDRLRTAIDELLAVPVRRAPIHVVPHPKTANTWAYADPALESLTPAQRHLLRMGPENIERIQDQLRSIRDQLGDD